MWYLGRVANPKNLKDAGLPFVGASSVYWNEESEKLAKEVGNELRELTEEEIVILLKLNIRMLLNVPLKQDLIISKCIQLMVTC